MNVGGCFTPRESMLATATSAEAISYTPDHGALLSPTTIREAGASGTSQIRPQMLANDPGF